MLELVAEVLPSTLVDVAICADTISLLVLMLVLAAAAAPSR